MLVVVGGAVVCVCWLLRGFVGVEVTGCWLLIKYVLLLLCVVSVRRCSDAADDNDAVDDGNGDE